MAPVAPLSMAALLHHLREAVGDSQGGVNEALHAVLQARLGPVVQLGAGAIHTLVPAHVRESVHLSQDGGKGWSTAGNWDLKTMVTN